MLLDARAWPGGISALTDLKWVDENVIEHSDKDTVKWINENEVNEKDSVKIIDKDVVKPLEKDSV